MANTLNLLWKCFAVSIKSIIFAGKKGYGYTL